MTKTQAKACGYQDKNLIVFYELRYFRSAFFRNEPNSIDRFCGVYLDTHQSFA